MILIEFDGVWVNPDHVVLVGNAQRQVQPIPDEVLDQLIDAILAPVVGRGFEPSPPVILENDLNATELTLITGRLIIIHHPPADVVAALNDKTSI